MNGSGTATGTSCRSSGERTGVRVDQDVRHAEPGCYPARARLKDRGRDARPRPSLIAAYDEEAEALIPEGAELFDAHVHVGRDIDGFTAPFDDLVSFLERYGFQRAFAFCMDEPDRHPAFRAANDRTLAAAERSEGCSSPSSASTLAEEPVEEAPAASTSAPAASSSTRARRSSS